MPWTYDQRSGRITSPNGQEFNGGYSGAPANRNNPTAENIANSGPIPRGTYRIAPARDSAQTGPHVLPLAPVGHNAHGRTNFQIHGDSIDNPGGASTGCIILPRAVRDAISNSGDTDLLVR